MVFNTINKSAHVQLKIKEKNRLAVFSKKKNPHPFLLNIVYRFYRDTVIHSRHCW